MKNYIINIQNENNLRVFKDFFTDMGYIEDNLEIKSLSKGDLELLFEGVMYDKKRLLRTRTTKYKENREEIDSMSSGEFVDYIYNNQDVLADIIYSKITGKFATGSFSDLEFLV